VFRAAAGKLPLHREGCEHRRHRLGCASPRGTPAGCCI
jgi:hypothetical protein